MKDYLPAGNSNSESVPTKQRTQDLAVWKGVFSGVSAFVLLELIKGIFF